jgi:hypothetical protein
MKSICLTLLFALTLGFAQKIPHFLYINTPILEPGKVIAGTLDEEDGQNLKDGSRLEVVQGRYNKGEVLEFTLTSVFDGYLTVYAPDKTILTYNDDTTSSEEGDYISTVVTEIPESGRYVFVISGYSSFDLGDYELSAKTLELGAEGPVTLPAEQNGLITYQDDLAEFMGEDEELGSLGDYNFDSYTFELSETATVRIEALSAALDTLVEVLDADGKRVAFNDDQNLEDDPATPDLDESYDYTTEAGVEVDLEAGSYEIRVAAYAPGFYTLSAVIVE